jgi:carboxylesterase type B
MLQGHRRERDEELLPVMVWIYGGMILVFLAGFSFERMEDTADRSKKGGCKPVQPMLGQQLLTGRFASR